MRGFSALSARPPSPSGRGRPPATIVRASRRCAAICDQIAPARAPRPPALQSRAMASTQDRTTRNLGRLTEIAQVAARHGFGYFLRRNRLSRPRTRRLERGHGDGLGSRPSPADDARRARPDVREVRAAALDAPGRHPARHRRRAARAAGRRLAGAFRAGARRGGGRARPAHGPGVPRIRLGSSGLRLDRAGAPGRAPGRQGGGRQGAAAGGGRADRGRPGAPLPGGAALERARQGARVHGSAGARGRVRALDPARARLRARGAERRDVPPQLRA